MFLDNRIRTLISIIFLCFDINFYVLELSGIYIWFPERFERMKAKDFENIFLRKEEIKHLLPNTVHL